MILCLSFEPQHPMILFSRPYRCQGVFAPKRIEHRNQVGNYNEKPSNAHLKKRFQAICPEIIIEFLQSLPHMYDEIRSIQQIQSP